MGNPFDPAFEDLPDTLPVFPLAGVLLLPRGQLPLNIFEPRYLAMVGDALGADRMIGMIQPKEPEETTLVPALYEVGCAGRITQFAETGDGRFLITLLGVCRFSVRRELAGARGYRRVSPDWSRFRADLEPAGDAGLDRPRLFELLRRYFELRGVNADWNALTATPDERLVTTLAMGCPFAPNEKQGILETETLAGRADMLLALLDMAVASGSSRDDDGGEHARH